MLVRLATRFAELGHKTDLVLLDGSRNNYAAELSPNVSVVNLDVPRWRFVKGIPALRRYLRREVPDAMLAALPTANAIAVWACALSSWHPRVVISERNADSTAVGTLKPQHRGMRNRLARMAIRSSYRFADGVIAISDGVAEGVRAVPGVRPERVHVIHNPSWSPEIEKRAAEPVDHPWLHDTGMPVILMVGRLVQQKDPETLLHAFALLTRSREARLIILGEGLLRRDLEACVRRLGLEDHVSMPGFSENPFAFMRRASVLALSSHNEGFGNVIVEAMACGTPVVSTDSVGPSEVLDGGRYGPLVPVGDAAALAEAIAATLDRPLPAETLKARAREFSVEKAADAYLRILLPEEKSSRLRQPDPGVA